MNPNPDFNDAAYLLAIAEQVERDIIDKYVDGDTPVKEGLLCEYVVYADREVPQASLHKFLALVRKIGSQAKDRLDKYELRRQDEIPYDVNAEDNDDEPSSEDPAPVAAGGPAAAPRAPRKGRRPRVPAQPPRGGG